MIPRLPSPLGYHIHCPGVSLRARTRGAAICLAVDGYVDVHNKEQLADHLRRFVKLQNPLILNVTGAQFADCRAAFMLTDFDDQCRQETVDWVLVADSDLALLLRENNSDTTDLPFFDCFVDGLRFLCEALQAKQRRNRVQLPANHAAVTV